MSTIGTMNRVGLTNREKEIFASMNEGLNTKQIAEKLDITTSTVANHRKNILKKMGARNRQELIRPNNI